MTYDTVIDSVDYLHAELALNRRLESAKKVAIGKNRDWFDNKDLGYYPSVDLEAAINRFHGYKAILDPDCCVIVTWV